MIDLSQEDFKESEFLGDRIRNNISQAARVLENRHLDGNLQDHKFTNLGTIDFLKAINTWKLAQYCNYDLAKFLSPHVLKRIAEFERENRSDLAIASWLRQISRKIELDARDEAFKKSLDATVREQIEWAAKALERTTREQTNFGEFANGEKRSAVGVLLESMGVSNRLWHGESRKSDIENWDTAIQELNRHLASYLVSRIRFLENPERYSFREIAKWLRLFIE